MPSVAQHDQSFVLSDGTRLAYTQHPAPRPSAPRLVLIHSLALDRTIWDEVVAALRGEAEILTYDCRGHGRSDRRVTTFAVQSFARDLLELLDHIGWQQVVAGGCSMGGCVAMAFAGLYPARTAALGLVDTTAWYGPEAPAQFRQRAEAARVKGMAGMIDFQLTRWFSDGFRASRPDVLARLASIYVANDFDCYAASCALLGDVDVRAHLPTLRVPVAIVVGEEDYATPVEMARQIHTAIPQSTLTVLPKARHLTPVERPDSVAEVLRGILSRT